MRQQTASLSQPEPVIIYDSRSTPLVLHGFHLFEKSPSNPIELKYGYTRVYPNSDGFVPYPQNFGRVIPVYPLFGYTRVYPYFSPGLVDCKLLFSGIRYFTEPLERHERSGEGRHFDTVSQTTDKPIGLRLRPPRKQS